VFSVAGKSPWKSWGHFGEDFGESKFLANIVHILASIFARVLVKINIQDIAALHVSSHALLLPLKG
jgi:hypothetical protein